MPLVWILVIGIKYKTQLGGEIQEYLLLEVLS